MADILLIHGSGIGAAGLTALARLIGGQAMDLPGYPEGTPPEGDALQTDADAVEARIGDREVVLFGHSYGGRVALEVACRGRAPIRALVVYEPVVQQFLQFDTTLVQSGPEAFLRATVDYWGGQGAFDALPPAMQQVYLSRAERMLAEGRSVSADPRTDWTVGVPTLVLHGAQSHPATASAYPALAEVLGARHQQVDGDHMAPVTRPKPVAAAIRRFNEDLACSG